jgi:hypothetical protein
MEGHLTADAILRAIQEQNAKHRAILEKCDGRYFEIAREIEDFLFDFITSNKDKIVLERQIRSRLGVNCNIRKLSSKTFAPVIRVSTKIFPGRRFFLFRQFFGRIVYFGVGF